MATHDGNMEGIASGKMGRAHEQPRGFIDIDAIDREDVIHDALERSESGRNSLATVDGGVPMQDLLQNLGIRHQLFAP